MAEAISQKDRLMSVKMPPGDDVLCVSRASVQEAVSRLFSMQLDLQAEDTKAKSIKYDQIVGKPATLSVELPGKKKRHFHGMVSRFSQAGSDERFAYYRAEVVPWLWLLSLTSDSKVFQDLTFPEIIEKVFKEWQGKFPELVKFENKLEASYTKVDYCVQYRETDFAFVSRLMEQEGIFYYFKHEDGKHTLVLGDSSAAFAACPNLEKARFLPAAGMGEWEDGVSSYEVSHAMVPGKFVLGDYHFQMSNKEIRPDEDGAVKIGNNSALELFDFPGEFAQRFNKPDERLGEVEKHAKDIVKWRMEEQRLPHLTISGGATARAFSTGCHFSLTGENDAQIKMPGTDGKYVLTSVRHSIEQSPDYISGDSARQPYRNSFTCIPYEVPYRPARTTARPAIQGVQSALVVGVSGEEIYCDKYGRVKVQFHWDREGQKNEKSSCWVRVGSLFASNQFGMINIPRMGDEVLVAFMEGDPDQPLIVGSVYNYDNLPPYRLPDNKTQSGIKTRSSLKGSDKNFNEIRFEDKKDSEQIFVQAEKNFDRVVKNNDTLKVGFETKDAGDQTIDIYNNRTTTLEMGTDKLTVKKKNREALIEMGNDSLTIKLGNQTTKLDLGKSETEAMQSIELKVGQSSLKVDQLGVTIKGLMVKVEGTVRTEVKGLMTQVQGTAILKAGGGITMIG